MSDSVYTRTLSPSTTLAEPTQNTADDAIPIDYVDPTAVLLQRLESWRHVVDMLESYTESHRILYHDLSRNYEKVSKTVLDAPRFDSVEVVEEGEKPAHEGISGGFFALRHNTEALINATNEAEKSIKSSVLPHVERLSHDIREHIKGLKNNGLKGAKDVEKARGVTQKQIEALGQFTSSFGIFTGKPDPLKDPYVIHRYVLNCLDHQILKENIQTDSLISIQREFKTFEAHIVDGVHQTFELMNQVQTTYWQAQQQAYATITDSFTSIPQEFEWDQFTAANKAILADENAPKRSIDRIKFPNVDHESTKPLIEGVIQRKGTMTFSKAYNSAYYVVTPSKYLHQFASKDYVQSPEPEFSIYLPDANLGAMYAKETGKNKFKLTAKDALKTISTKHTYEFKTSTYDDLVKWWNVIHDVATSGSGTLISPKATMSSIDTAAAVTPTAVAAVASPTSEASVADLPVAGTKFAESTSAEESSPVAESVATPISEYAYTPATPATEYAEAEEPVAAESAPVRVEQTVIEETTIEPSTVAQDTRADNETADVWKQ